MSLLIPSNLMKSLLTIRKVQIDGFIFRLHYKTTVALLVTFAAVIGLFHIFSDPIDCAVEIQYQQMLRIIDKYCWTQATYKNAWKSSQNKYKVDIVDLKPKYIYYQWGFFVLLLQAFFIYLPHIIWKWLEGNLVKELTSAINSATTASKKEDLLGSLVGTLDEAINSRENKWYFLKYIFSLVINLVCFAGQAFLLNYVLESEFATYGIDVLKFDFPTFAWNGCINEDPRIKIFPRIVECTFDWRVHKGEALCVLPLNVIYGKIFLFLWFWFALVGTLSLLDIFLWSFAGLRILRVRSLTTLAGKLRISGSVGNKIKQVVRRCSVGDWFLLYLLGINLDKSTFKLLLTRLSEENVDKDFNGITTQL